MRTIALIQAKGGQGTTTTACALALTMAHGANGRVLIVDTRGDVLATIGAPTPQDVEAAPAEVAPNVDVMNAHRGILNALDLARDADYGTVIVDAGTGDLPGMGDVETVLLVTRPCYVALRRALNLDTPPHGVIVVAEPGRVLDADDIANAIGAPVVAEVPYDRAIARTVDAGLLTTRLPRALADRLADVA